MSVELDRWFLTIAGSVDAITAGVLLALARRLRRTLLVLYLPPQWSGIRLKTATMSSLALTTVDPVHGSLGEDEARPKLQGTGEG
jgi:hypothetical protein